MRARAPCVHRAPAHIPAPRPARYAPTPPASLQALELRGEWKGTKSHFPLPSRHFQSARLMRTGLHHQPKRHN
eukprot:1031659-Pleurochrysis_carterae.AAC.3